MAAIFHSYDAHWRAAAWLAALAGLTAITSRPEDGWLIEMDQAVLGRVVRQRGEPVIRAARAISAVAEPKVAVLPLAIAAAMAARRRGWRPPGIRA